MYKNITDDFIVTTISEFTEEMVLIEQKLEILSETAEDDAEKIEAASLPGRSDEVKVQFHLDTMGTHPRKPDRCNRGGNTSYDQSGSARLCGVLRRAPRRVGDEPWAFI